MAVYDDQTYKKHLLKEGVTDFDQQITMIAYATYHNNTEENSSTGKFVNEMLQLYHSYLTTNNPDIKTFIETSMFPYFSQNLSIKKKSAKTTLSVPMKRRMKTKSMSMRHVQVGAGYPPENNGNPGYTPVQVQVQQEKEQEEEQEEYERLIEMNERIAELKQKNEGMQKLFPKQIKNKEQLIGSYTKNAEDYAAQHMAREMSESRESLFNYILDSLVKEEMARADAAEILKGSGTIVKGVKTLTTELGKVKKELTWGGALTMGITSVFKKMIMFAAKVTYKTIKFFVVDSFIMPVKLALKSILKPVGTVYGYFLIAMVAGVIYMTYVTQSSPDFTAMCDATYPARYCDPYEIPLEILYDFKNAVYSMDIFQLAPFLHIQTAKYGIEAWKAIGTLYKDSAMTFVDGAIGYVLKQAEDRAAGYVGQATEGVKSYASSWLPWN